MQNNAERFWASKMSRYKRYVVKADVAKSNVYCILVDLYDLCFPLGYRTINMS